MCESALWLRRRCLFLSDEATVGTALRCSEVAKKADDILLRVQASRSGAVDGAGDLSACTHRWMESRQFADWQECVECLLLSVEWRQERGDAATAEGALCRQALLELTALFADEARAYDAAAASYAETYWRKAQKRQRVLASSEPSEKTTLVGARVSWSIAAELPLRVEQAFLLP
ncbi:hypothetical protein TraAM80_02050 [Trypanosoma rangeli]|uniref:Uncharacterized protein n=1 Tax=Trypanosoma rangeli TaxID=5698 RepID=A0A3R7KL71_TRYRA|nr:uncharacterized protein TraAM80_02050 [Trypanosoma rangeli]RNF09694.1 hypothetical protein TraAM80_02050 [Trypanosoma rangeli]|eukprot:RNF09694.1 hypothetical protein TraAM80_02050 [Trypanosoma rangeli]